MDGVILYEGRILIPPRLRNEVSRILHMAYQGTSQMGNRAVDAIFWPGYTTDIMTTRKSCAHCEVNAPSQNSQRAMEPFITSAPFEAVATDYCDVKGHHYIILVDRFSNWPVVYKVNPGTYNSGAKGLLCVLREVFARFGVPDEVSSDGGPEYHAEATQKFFERWGIRHRK